jgi:general stress protein 26
MEVTRFDELQPEFINRVRRAVYCNMATVDQNDRPRSRMMHPIWDGPIGWVITSPQSHKAKHLQRNPYISLAYIYDIEKPVYVDCLAEWISDVQEKERIWKLHKDTPPPLGFDPQPHYGSIEHVHYGLLKFVPWRCELGNLYGEPIIWRKY